MLRSLSRAALLAMSILPLACSSNAGDDGPVEQAAESSLFSGTPQPDIGQFFMVEHYGVVSTGYADVHDMVKKKNLGAIILWNPTNASGDTARQMVSAYAKSAHDARTDELFVAADQEERGTQRFKSLEGFTDLVDGATLGRAVQKNGDPRVCDLHARITAREMSSVGMNMALGTVSDIFTTTSGTPGMFRTRAIDSRSDVVASCITAMTKAYGEEAHVVFITKHFPGLGNASGNTDVDPHVHTESVTTTSMERELAPYRSATAAVNAAETWQTFGTMISHAAYPILDGTGSAATLSPVILQTLLRGSETEDLALGGVDSTGKSPTFKGMHLQGVTVSDAFWTWGATKNSTPIEKRRLMAQSFIAGMDILMIAKTDFSGAWDYFQALYARELPPDEQAALVLATHATDFDSLHATFVARVDESAKRIRASKTAVGPASSFMRQGTPSDASADLVAEYHRLTQ